MSSFLVNGIIFLVFIGQCPDAEGLTCHIGSGQTQSFCTVCSETTYEGQIVKQGCDDFCSPGYDLTYGKSSWGFCCDTDYCNGVNLGAGPGVTCYTGSGTQQYHCTICSQTILDGKIVSQGCDSTCTPGVDPAYGPSSCGFCCNTDNCNGNLVSLCNSAVTGVKTSQLAPIPLLVFVWLVVCG